MRITPWVIAWTLCFPCPSFASSIEVVPKKPAQPEKPSRPAPAPAPEPEPEPRPAEPVETPPPSARDTRLRAVPPPPPGRFRLKPLPLLGIGAGIAAGLVGTGLLIGAAGELDRDQFTFDAEEQDDGTIDIDITDEFRDAQRAVILKGFGGTFLVSASATLISISLLELFRRSPR